MTTQNHTVPVSSTSVCHLAARRARVRHRRWFSVLAAMASATAVWAVAVVGAGVDLQVQQGAGQRDVGSLEVTLTSLGVGLAAWLLLELLEHRVGRALLVWRVAAGAVLVVSLTGPLAAVGAGATAVLLCLHLLVGTILLVGLGARGLPQ